MTGASSGDSTTGCLSRPPSCTVFFQPLLEDVTFASQIDSLFLPFVAVALDEYL